MTEVRRTEFPLGFSMRTLPPYFCRWFSRIDANPHRSK